MPSRDHHLDQTRHNALFYATIDKSAFADWAVTVLFYTGLHYIDAFLAGKASGVHPTKHKVRDNAVARLAELKPIYAHYSFLKNASFNARYEPPVSYTLAQVEDYETKHLARIKAEIGRYISI